MKRDAGFSIVEIAFVVGLMMVFSTVAVIRMKQSMAILDADKASDLVVQQVRYARGVAVDGRRDVNLGFYGSNQIKVIRQDGGGASTTLADVTLPSGYTFGLPMGVGDTPEGYGNAAAVSIGLATSGTFLGDGTFVDPAGVVTSGSIFTIGGGNGSARAVTVTGASGRVKQYYLKGNVWVDR
jgi:type II secretory pathway pseudopilin PulG